MKIMNTDKFFDLAAETLKLGKVIEKPVQITGGLMHKMFKVVTDEGRYIIKLLNQYTILFLKN